MDQLKRAMPQAMIEAAGGRNIFDDLDSSWMRGNWEDVIARDPDWIVIVDDDRPTPSARTWGGNISALTRPLIEV